MTTQPRLDFRTGRPLPLTQTDRLVAFLHANPGASSLEITLACGIVNTTGRISDARAAGVDVICARRADGRLGYHIRERLVPLVGVQEGLAL